MLQRFFPVSFLMIAKCDFPVSLGHSQPVAICPKNIEGLFGVISIYGYFVQGSVYSRKRAIYGSRQTLKVIFLCPFQIFFKKCYCLRLIREIVVTDRELCCYTNLGFSSKIAEVFLILEWLEQLERLFIFAYGLERKRQKTFYVREVIRNKRIVLKGLGKYLDRPARIAVSKFLARARKDLVQRIGGYGRPLFRRR